MRRSEIVARVQVFLREGRSHILSESLVEDTPLFENGVMNSLTMVETALFLEREFGVRVVASELSRERFGSLAAIAEFIEARLSTSSLKCPESN